MTLDKWEDMPPLEPGMSRLGATLAFDDHMTYVMAPEEMVRSREAKGMSIDWIIVDLIRLGAKYWKIA